MNSKSKSQTFQTAQLAKKMATIVLSLTVILLTKPCPAQKCIGGWYKGDLHAHSNYSDGDSSVAEVIAGAESLGLDFFVITDHDTHMDGKPWHWDDPDYYSDEMVLLYGVEWTSDSGHANTWSSSRFYYDDLWQANLAEDAETALTAAHNEGALFSINHPTPLGCCPWQYPVYQGVDSIEVWNAMYRLPSANGWAGHHFWEDLLISGRRIPGVGGSDMHHLEKWQSYFYGLGNPTTWIFTEELNGEGILAGIAAGHASISYAPDAVRLDFEADADGDGCYETMMGDNISESGKLIKFRVEIVGFNADSDLSPVFPIELSPRVVKNLEIGVVDTRDLLDRLSKENDEVLYAMGVFKNGKLFRVWVISEDVDEIFFEDTPESTSYYRVELAGDPDVFGISRLLYGKVIALTNPIYVEYAE